MFLLLFIQNLFTVLKKTTSNDRSSRLTLAHQKQERTLNSTGTLEEESQKVGQHVFAADPLTTSI